MESKIKGIKILSVEAKDLYNSNNLVTPNEKGYSTKMADGNFNKKAFINVLDYSLDTIKLKEVYEKIYRNQDFSFTDNKHQYTYQVINVKFKYSQRDFNKACKNVFVRNGYQWRDVKTKFKDGILVIDGVLVAIEVNKTYKRKSEITDDILAPYFKYEDGMYKQSKEFDCVKSRSELRDYLYEYGFVCNGIKYVRWKRSSGSSRVGKCLFINTELYSRMHRWETCGLSLRKGCCIDLAALEAYISLTSSSIIDTMELRPENFLIVDDYESIFTDKCMGVQYENGQLTATEKEYEIKNSIFDGESLLDVSAFPDEYQQYSMLLLRQRMFKSACFKANIQQWFADNGITDVSQLNGFTLAGNISDIKIITTPSSIKYVKFGSIEKWLEILEPTFGIVKHEKPTHYFDGRKVSCHYQLLNTLQLSEDDVKELLKPTFDYIAKIKTDPAVLRHHIDLSYEELELNPLNSKNEIIFKLLSLNEDFAKTQMYYDFRDDLVRSLMRELKQGHVLINGNYSTLLGNGIEMLQQSIGTFKGESVIGVGNIHSKRFEYGRTILGSRSPHVCAGNVLLVQNVESKLIDKYFPLSNEIVYINSINENILQRLDGADFDSDCQLLTDNPILIKAAQKNYDKFSVPTSFISAKKMKRYYTNSQKSDLDVKTSVNKIGEDINLSQYLNSIFWQNIHKGQTFEQNKELYGDICKLAALSGVEIDKAKKEFEVDTGREIRILKDKYNIVKLFKNKKTGETEEKNIKPMFFKMITLENGYELSENNCYQYFHTPMDYLQKQANDFNFKELRHIKNDVLPFSTIVKRNRDVNPQGFYYKQRDRIIDLIRDTNKELKVLYTDYDTKTKEEKREIGMQASEIKQGCTDYINDMALHETTMYLLLLAIDSTDYKDIKRRVLLTLFGTPNKVFYSMIRDNQDKLETLVEDPKGTELLYDIKYSRIA